MGLRKDQVDPKEYEQRGDADQDIAQRHSCGTEPPSFDLILAAEIRRMPPASKMVTITDAGMVNCLSSQAQESQPRSARTANQGHGQRGAQHRHFWPALPPDPTQPYSMANRQVLRRSHPSLPPPSAKASVTMHLPAVRVRRRPGPTPTGSSGAVSPPNPQRALIGHHRQDAPIVAVFGGKLPSVRLTRF